MGNGAAGGNTGSNVTAIGFQSAAEQTGDNVVGIGEDAAGGNIGNNIDCIGYQTGLDNTGFNLNAFGYQAAKANGGDNVNAMGYQAAVDNKGGSVNAFGGAAAQKLSNERDGLAQLRETVLAIDADGVEEVPLIATFELNHLVSRSIDKGLFWQDLLLAKSVMQNI